MDGSYRPSFSISANGNSTISLKTGGSASLEVSLRGNSSSPLSIQLSDSGSATSTGANIAMHADKNVVDSLAGNQTVNVTVDAGNAPGRYTLLVTATDGLISRSVYVQVAVLP